MSIEVVYCPENDMVISPIEVLALLPSGLVLHNMGTIVVKIRADLVVKYGSCVLASEAQSMNFVRKHTDILVPYVYLVFRQNGCQYIVMQYVDGVTLEHQWDIMDESGRSEILTQFAKYMRQLRALDSSSSRPGPIDNTACRGQWFTIYNAGPFQTHAELVEWLNHKADVAHSSADAFTTNHRLVFTHQDLAPRNFILDRKNQLWVIDWELAGWYPAYFEYACVASMLHPIPKDWSNKLLSCLGPYELEYRSLQGIMWSLEFTPFA
jgi:serine/threonine protein kinase